MGIVNHQDLWIAGSRFYFKRADQGTTQFPLLDLGTVVSNTPTVENETVECEDADGGVKIKIAEEVVSFDETWEVELKNLNMDNLALLFRSSVPQNYAQTALTQSSDYFAHAGRLLKLLDESDDRLGAYSIGSIDEVWDADVDLTQFTLTDITATPNTLVVSEDASHLVAGNRVAVRTTGLGDTDNAGGYTVVSTAGTGPTTITVSAAPNSAEASITGELIGLSEAGTQTQLTLDTDYEVVSLERGLIRMIPVSSGGGFSADGNVLVIHTLAVVASGLRLIEPGTITGALNGQGYLILSRGSNAQQTVREIPSLALSSNGFNIDADDFSSLTLLATVLSDTAKDAPLGRMLQFTGDVPSLS